MARKKFLTSSQRHQVENLAQERGLKSSRCGSLNLVSEGHASVVLSGRRVRLECDNEQCGVGRPVLLLSEQEAEALDIGMDLRRFTDTSG